MLAKLTALIGTVAVATGVYVAPTHSRGGALAYCPSLVGLRGFSQAAVKTARVDVLRYGRVSRADDLAASDLAWQPNVRTQWRGQQHDETPSRETREFLLERNWAEPGWRSSSAIIVKRSCGAKIISDTITLTTAPGTRSHPLRCDACRTTFFLIDRRGHPLIYFIY